MSCWLNRFWRNRDGNSTVEFALFMPLFLILMTGGLELGNAVRQATELEKSLRSGALYASRMMVPGAVPLLATADQTTVQNLVKTGGQAGTDPYLVPGWADAGATLTIDTSLVHTFSSANATPLDVNIPVVRLSAAVPYQPLLPGLFDFVGLNAITFQLSHEQAYVGL
jgi:Flp pilus assembly protein TadG